ncbi:aminopeptidase family protein P [Candidatus Pelagibacter sp.]|nr:aminopeptidase family protein P [Candidatus Pelagibacter sp.]|tara:strand:- start:68 stop:1765 length:1698 start_codon:yes stop_codon:yes gene_type:complete
MINLLKKLMVNKNIDGYIIPKNDEFFSEYSFPNRLKFISNFSGSAGLALILKDKNLLFVDGRYTLQASIECGKNFKIYEIPKIRPFDVLKKLKDKLTLGFDPKLFTEISLKSNFRDSCNLIPVNNNLIDEIFNLKNSSKTKEFYCLNENAAGEKIKSKLNKLRSILKKKKIQNIFISAPENCAWLLNIRGFDNPNSPIPNCQIILNNKKIYFFANIQKIKKIKKKINYKEIKFYDFKEFVKIINNLKGKNFSIDKNSCSIFNKSIISSKFNILNEIDPCYALKAIKNKTEIKNMADAHIADGAALTKFLYWLKNKKKFNFTELEVEKKLENFRKKNNNFLYPSFNTIAGSGPNGAIIHYRANKNSNRKITKKDIFLCDSGGQYKYGTTDVTRTICFSKPSSKIKNIFTRVLKGHIAVFNTNLNKINTGEEIDKRARFFLKKVNLNYGHGTGHGVGYFLNVHEGPQAISKYNNIKILPGMILSNEPGYYEKKKFGIRIENLVYVERNKNKIFFKNLTFAPIDTDLINFKMLNTLEKKYLFSYHMDIYAKISKFLNSNEKKWLLSLI